MLAKFAVRIVCLAYKVITFRYIGTVTKNDRKLQNHLHTHSEGPSTHSGEGRRQWLSRYKGRMAPGASTLFFLRSRGAPLRSRGQPSLVSSSQTINVRRKGGGAAPHKTSQPRYRRG